MSNSNDGGCLAFLMIVIFGAAWLGSGYLAWNWIEPDSFGSAILFPITWGILGYIANIFAGLIVAAISGGID